MVGLSAVRMKAVVAPELGLWRDRCAAAPLFRRASRAAGQAKDGMHV